MLPRWLQAPAIPVLGLALLALAVRLAAAASCGPMNDEAFTALVSSRPVAEILTAARPDNNPPGYYLLLHPLAVRTGNVLLLRLPSILAGVGAVLLGGLAGRRLGLGWGPGLGLACAWSLWLADGQIRQYGVLLLAATAALVLSLQACRAPLKRPEAALYLGACALLPLANYSGFMAVGALTVAALAGPGSRRGLAGLSLLALAPGLGWLAWALAGPARSDLLRSAFAAPSVRDALQVPGYLAGLSAPLYWPARGPVPGTALLETVLGLVLAGLAVLGFLRLRARGAGPEAWTLAATLLLPLGGLLAMGVSGAQAFQPRYLVPQAVPFLLLVFSALSRTGNRALALVVVGVNLGTAALFPSSPHLWNQDWPSAARWIRQREAPGDRLAVWRPYSLLGLNFSYAPGEVGLDLSEAGRMGFEYGPGYQGLPQEPLVGAPDPRSARRLFVVLCPSDDPAANRLIEALNQDWEVLDARLQPSVHAWGRIAVYLLGPRRPER